MSRFFGLRLLKDSLAAFGLDGQTYLQIINSLCTDL
jgi:hypothetical protein